MEWAILIVVVSLYSSSVLLSNILMWCDSEDEYEDERSFYPPRRLGVEEPFDLEYHYALFFIPPKGLKVNWKKEGF